MAHVLFVDDDPDFTAATKILLKAEMHEVQVAGSLKEARDALDRTNFDMLFVDLSLPDGSGLELVSDDGPKAVIITGHPSMESAISAVRGRVVDYLVKPLDKSQLIRSIKAAQPDEIARPLARERVGQREDGYSNIVGESAAIRALQVRIGDYASTDITVLVSGESGTGKELVAQALHKARNSDAPFVALNCGAIPQDLVASELFGHEKGSFTGAAAMRKGIFERAGKGTVFLDEIGELPLQQQVALLRVIETRTIQRVGGEKELPVTPRIIAATNKDLEKEVSDGNFREDLFYRLNVLTIKVPPLRDREGDIEVLACHFLENYAKDHGTPTRFSPETLDKLTRYHWPGNVRELKHTVLRAAILNRGKEIIEELPENFDRPPKWTTSSNNLRAGMSIRDVEKSLIEKTLDHFDGNKKLTAEALGVSLKTLYNRLREYGDSSADED
jgi:DNA-binding NtrC family response regulator